MQVWLKARRLQQGRAATGMEIVAGASDDRHGECNRAFLLVWKPNLQFFLNQGERGSKGERQQGRAEAGKKMEVCLSTQYLTEFWPSIELCKLAGEVAINWCICKGTIPIPGVKTLKQAQENLGALGWRLSSKEILELESAARESSRKMVQNIFQTR